jgi:hypothetical protein
MTRIVRLQIARLCDVGGDIRYQHAPRYLVRAQRRDRLVLRSEKLRGEGRFQ